MNESQPMMSGSQPTTSDSQSTTSASQSTTSASTPGSSRKRTRHHSEKMWPKRSRSDIANTIIAAREGDWAIVDKVKVYGIEGYCRYSQYYDCDHVVALSDNYVEITSQSGRANLECKDQPSIELFRRAKFICERVYDMPNLDNVESIQNLSCYSREALEPESGSDGEDIPDYAITPEFNTSEMVLVKYLYKDLYKLYVNAVDIGLYNCVGKYFLDALGNFLNVGANLDVNKESEFLHIHSTSSSGNVQPGALYVKWSKKIDKHGIQRERFADHVTYDKVKVINFIVSEVKENEKSAIESQNNEQMIGLWRAGQKAMLGLEAKGITIKPKVLVLDENDLNMYYLKELNITNNADLKTLAYLMMAFMICVCYC